MDPMVWELDGRPHREVVDRTGGGANGGFSRTGQRWSFQDSWALSRSAAWAAASRATGTLNGEQDT